MQLPLQVVFRDIPHSDAVENAIKKKAEKLEQFYDQIMSCRVSIEMPHSHHHKGKLYRIRIDLKVPDREIVVERSPKEHHAHEDIYVAIRDAFNAVSRQLQQFVDKRRGKTKSHETPAHGKIVELVPIENFGRIQSADGKEIYFHRNSIVNADFDKLEEGAEVRFTEESGEEGPQASSVQIVGKHHIVG